MRFKAENLPAGMKLKWYHVPLDPFHGTKWYTLAAVVDATGCTVAMGEARCSLKDTPSRRIGREVAYIRAKLDAMASNSSQNMIICHNCDSALPEGCGGQFKDDGDACALNAAISAGEWKDE